MRFVSANQRVNFPIWIIIAIAIAIGGASVAKLKFGAVTTNQIIAAESTYAAALTVADNYVMACRTGTLPATCKANVVTIQKDVKVTDAAYQTVKGFEQNPPAGTAQTFLDAVAVLQAALPAVSG